MAVGYYDESGNKVRLLKIGYYDSAGKKQYFDRFGSYTESGESAVLHEPGYWTLNFTGVAEVGKTTAPYVKIPHFYADNMTMSTTALIDTQDEVAYRRIIARGLVQNADDGLQIIGGKINGTNIIDGVIRTNFPYVDGTKYVIERTDSSNAPVGSFGIFDYDVPYAPSAFKGQIQDVRLLDTTDSSRNRHYNLRQTSPSSDMPTVSPEPLLISSEVDYPTTLDSHIVRYDYSDKSFTKVANSPPPDYADAIFSFAAQKYSGKTVRLTVSADILHVVPGKGIHFLIRDNVGETPDLCYMITYNSGKFEDSKIGTITTNRNLSDIYFLMFFENLDSIPVGTKIFENLQFKVEDLTNDRIIDTLCTNASVKEITAGLWRQDSENPNKYFTPSTAGSSLSLIRSAPRVEPVRLRIFNGTPGSIVLYWTAKTQGDLQLPAGYSDVFLDIGNGTKLNIATQETTGYIIIDEVSLYTHGQIINASSTQPWVPVR